MKRLSVAQAQRCEDAATRRCRCRCGGTLHGANRGDVEALPFGDPHFPHLWVQLELPYDEPNHDETEPALAT